VNLVIALLMAVGVATSSSAPLEKTPPPPPVAVERTPVYLQTDAQDPVGAIYVAKLRAALEGSSDYRPVVNPSAARFVIAVLTMDPNETESEAETGRATVASVTLQRENPTGLNEFVYGWVLTAKWNKVDVLVTALISAIDKEIHDFDGTTIAQ
jgi:hypothetical protein